MAASFEFEIDGRAYKARRLDAFAQMALLSKVSPLIAAGFGEVVAFIVAMRKEGIASLADAPLERAAGLIAPVARELAKLSEDDQRGIIAACLASVERKADGQGWAKIWNDAANRAASDDIQNDLFLILKITFQVFQGNFARFFPASLSTFLGGEAA